MGDSVIADFTARVVTPRMGGNKPVRSRVLLANDRLIAVSSNEKVTVPTDRIVHVSMNSISGKLERFFSNTITVKYRTKRGGQTLHIEKDGAMAEKFRLLLTNLLLRGTTVLLYHPARRSGRMLEPSSRRAKISAKRGKAVFSTKNGSLSIDLSSVIHLRYETEETFRTSYPSVECTHRAGTQPTTTIVAAPDTRKLQLLGQYLQSDYRDTRGKAEKVALSAAEENALGAVQVGLGPDSIPTLLPEDAPPAADVVEKLQKKELVERGKERFRTTILGEIALRIR
ncbi:CheF family chemotaxis protein [Natronobacterium texcoconense]|uniref:HTH domain-containing protein n=1 Tax=Natronobacterium texcoconense TaxID=1095778 RepID=A0A1H1EDH8_NATTX|nr:CheF family chemotaxis protein [Natronobacterium texcoconense]SDQ86588.1 HTH domain-containing protein [Natronobacterium texcoconense]